MGAADGLLTIAVRDGYGSTEAFARAFHGGAPPAGAAGDVGGDRDRMVPSNPWQLRPGPSIVAVLEHDEDCTTATCELWLPVERA